MLFVVEVRGPDGVWRRAEPLVPNPWGEDAREIFAEKGGLVTLEGPLVHARWSFAPRDAWLKDVRWPVRHDLPVDITPSAWEYLEVYTEDPPRSCLSLRDIEAVDWLAAYHAWFMTTMTPEEREAFILQVREAVLSRLRALGGPDDVRVLYGWNV